MTIAFVSRVVKSLKRRYAQTVEFQRIIQSSFDPATGQIDRRRDTWTIEQALISPKSGVRDFAYDLSFIAANKNFTYGATFDPSTRDIVIWAGDLPEGLVPTVTDFVSIGIEIYKIKQVDIYDDSAGQSVFHLKVLHVDGDEADDIKRVSVQSDLEINQVVDGEIE